MGLPNVEKEYLGLLRNPDEVLISQEEAYQVWVFFQPKDTSLDIGAFADFSYKAFMQAALASAVEGSEAMSWIETLWKGSVRPNSTVRSLLKKLAKHAVKKFWRDVNGGSVDIYGSVMSSIRYQCAHYFRSMKQGMEI
jgi:hypothetical protein